MSLFGKATRSVMLGGLFLIIPLVVIIIIGTHAIEILSPLGKSIGHRIGVSTIFGKATLTIITLMLLLFFCYLAGLLLRIGLVSAWGDKVEEKIFLFFPQLQIIKYRIAGESSMKSVWTPILLKEENYYVLVFVTSSLDQPVWSIYVPESPKLDSGEIRYMKKEDCVYESISMKQAMDAVISFGKKGNIQQQLNDLTK
ncbi:hypothetical protein ACX0HA_12455 [Flavobacterium hauense]